MGQPAYAAVAVALIFIVLIGSVVGYKLYRKWQWRKIRKQQEVADELAAAEAATNPSFANQQQIRFPMRSTSPGPSVIGSLYGEAYPRESIGGRVSMSKASLYSVPAPAYYNGSSASEYALSRPRRSSSQGLLRVGSPVASPAGYVSQEQSMPGSPISQSVVGANTAADGSPPLEAHDGPAHQRALSSASSTMTLRRQYAASTYRTGAYGGGVSPGPYHARGVSPSPYHARGVSPGPYHVRRDSYLPHLPENRDHVQIIPPTPLGFGLGGMAQAVDQKTLAFSKTSGIGDFDEDFSKGLLWAGQTPAEAEAAARSANVSEEERQRYLAQGPLSSSQSRSNMTPAVRGAIHNMLYNTASQPGSSGAQTPDAPGSRSRSPTHNQWDGTGSSSDIGPSVSQRGANMPSHPLEQMHNVGRAAPTAGVPGLIHDERSPLSGLMHGGQHDTSMADISSNTISDSPILQAFQNPAQVLRQNMAVAAANGGHTPQDSMNSTHGGVGTPGLMSSSDSRSQTSSRTGPPSLAHAQQQQQQQAALQHSPPPQLASPPIEKRTSRGWFSMPSWRQSTGDPSAA